MLLYFGLMLGWMRLAERQRSTFSQYKMRGGILFFTWPSMFVLTLGLAPSPGLPCHCSVTEVPLLLPYHPYIYLHQTGCRPSNDFKISFMQIIPLSEGSFTIDGTKNLFHFNTATDDLQQRPVGSLSCGDTICIVTQRYCSNWCRLGFANADGSLQIHQNLMNNGINPMDVTKVLMSHLHKDHSNAVWPIPTSCCTSSFWVFPKCGLLCK